MHKILISAEKEKIMWQTCIPYKELIITLIHVFLLH
uniref:Uncharacterized protein n=1 Tax=Rhizophora mucronata TaxID=61149 RepID=A0A2P2LWI7_RHIMU